MENEPLEYAFPIENGDIPANYVGLPEGTQKTAMHFPNTPLRPPTPILSSFDDGLAPPSTAEVLSDYGYDTAAFGKWHNTPINDLFKSGPFDQYPTGFLDIAGWWFQRIFIFILFGEMIPILTHIFQMG